MLKYRSKADSKGASPVSPQGNSAKQAAVTRSSNGLDQFFSSIQGQQNLRILDFTGANQANISFITNLGHRIYSDDILRTLDEAFGGEGDFIANQSNPQRIERFLNQTLDFPPAHFDGALVWDTLQFLAPPLLQLTIERLRYVMQSSANLLAIFRAEEKANVIPVYTYRITDPKTLSLSQRGERKPAQFFNNRSIEKLFQEFQSVKFFLARDNLREVIVRR